MFTVNVVELMKFITDSVIKIVAIVRKEKKAQKRSLDLGNVLELYGGLTRIRNLCQDIIPLADKVAAKQTAIKPQPTNDPITSASYLQTQLLFEDNIKDLRDTIMRVIRRMRDINHQIINIYHPNLSAALSMLVLLEFALAPGLEDYYDPLYRMTPQELKELKDLYDELEHDKRLEGPIIVANDYKKYEPSDIDALKVSLEIAIESTDRCRMHIMEMVKANWSLEQLFEPTVGHNSGIRSLPPTET
jgi:hypothetical protein